MKDTYLSPGRIKALENLRNKTGKGAEEVREAMELRRHIPNLAEEYLNRKDIPGEMAEGVRYPLWAEYLNMTANTPETSWE